MPCFYMKFMLKMLIFIKLSLIEITWRCRFFKISFNSASYVIGTLFAVMKTKETRGIFCLAQ